VQPLQVIRFIADNPLEPPELTFVLSFGIHSASSPPVMELFRGLPQGPHFRFLSSHGLTYFPPPATHLSSWPLALFERCHSMAPLLFFVSPTFKKAITVELFSVSEKHWFLMIPKTRNWRPIRRSFFSRPAEWLLRMIKSGFYLSGQDIPRLFSKQSCGVFGVPSVNSLP